MRHRGGLFFLDPESHVTGAPDVPRRRVTCLACGVACHTARHLRSLQFLNRKAGAIFRAPTRGGWRVREGGGPRGRCGYAYGPD